MSVDNTTKTNGRRTKSSQKSEEAAETAETAAVAENTDKNSGESSAKEGKKLSETEQSEAMSSDNVVKITARPVQSEAQGKQGSIQLHQQASLSGFNRPVMSSEMEVVETYSEAGLRPIAASHLQVYGTMLNNRPIACSSLRLYDTLPGSRPIFYSEIQMIEGTGLPGDRPIMVSPAALLEGSTLPGNRPIASNEIDEPDTLMGFLD